MENHSTCLETYATLRIFSKAIHPDKISSVLGLQSTDPRPKQPDSKYRARREYHYWRWSSSSMLQSVDGLEHVRAITSLLDGKEQQLQQLREAGCEIDVCCFRVSTGQGGPFLDVPTLAALAHLELEIWWDIYFGDDPDEYKNDATVGGGASGS